MKVRLGDVLRECKRRGIQFSDEGKEYEKIYKGLNKFWDACEKAYQVGVRELGDTIQYNKTGLDISTVGELRQILQELTKVQGHASKFLDKVRKNLK